MSRRPLGEITRGTTNPNRLRRVAVAAAAVITLLSAGLVGVHMLGKGSSTDTVAPPSSAPVDPLTAMKAD